MDYGEILKLLYAERERVDRMIAALEQILPPSVPPKRGRKTMGPEERRAVAERMRSYWKQKKDTGK